MRQKKPFITPAILQELSLLGESPILQGSVASDMTVTATGQEVEDYDFGSANTEGFNHTWGN